MIINKRLKRSAKNNCTFYLSIAILTMVSIILFLTIYTAGKSISNSVEKFMSDNKIEDAEFTTYIPIEDEDIKKLESDYETVIEKVKYINYEYDDKLVRVFSKPNKINKYQVVKGKDIYNEDEILLSKTFAENNNIKIDDKYKINGNEYTVVGFCEKSDYLYMLKELTDSYKNDETFGIAIVSEEAIEKLQEVSEYFSVRYLNDDNYEKFRKKINEDYTTLIYTSAANNQRISYPKNSPKSYITMACAIFPIMLAFIIGMIAIVLSRKIKQEEKIIGTIYALGYRKKEIRKYYGLFAAIPGVLGSVLGILASIILVNPIAGHLGKGIENIFGKFKLPVLETIICLIIPVSLYIITTYFTVNKLLKIKPAYLLSNNDEKGKVKNKIFSHNKKISFKRKFRLRVLLGNKKRTLIALCSIILSGFIMEIGFICNNSVASFIDKSIDKMGTFKYEYYLNTLYEESKVDNKGETLVYGNFQPKDNESQFLLIGTENSNPYIKLKNLEGEVVNLDKGYYMTKNASKLYGIEKGDKFTFYNLASMEEYTVTISDIIDDDSQKILYTSKENAKDILNIDEKHCNLIMSSDDMKLDDSIVAMTNSKESLEKQLNTVLDSTKMMIAMVIIVGIIICVFTIYLVVNMIVEENRVNISMLKVLGYKTKEINNLVLNVNNILLPIGFIISIPLSVQICEAYFKMMIDNFACYIKAEINLLSIFICLVIITISYFISLAILKRKVYKVDMVESLKDNR